MVKNLKSKTNKPDQKLCYNDISSDKNKYYDVKLGKWINMQKDINFYDYLKINFTLTLNQPLTDDMFYMLKKEFPNNPSPNLLFNTLGVRNDENVIFYNNIHYLFTTLYLYNLINLDFYFSHSFEIPYYISASEFDKIYYNEICSYINKKLNKSFKNLEHYPKPEILFKTIRYLISNFTKSSFILNWDFNYEI